MKKLHIYLAIGAGIFLGCQSILPAQAQSAVDKVIFEAMDDELQRNGSELSLENAGTPFFISYIYARSKTFQIVGSMGALLEASEQPWTGTGTVELLLGDYHRTSNVMYEGNFVPAGMPIDVNYNAIRRSYWLATDEAYKYALQYFAWKEASQKANPQTPEEEKLDDLCKIQPIEKIIESIPYEFDKALWEKNIEEISAVFKDYKELFNSVVGVRGLEMDVYKKTTEGTVFKQPVGYVKLFASATTFTKDGTKMGDSYSLVVRSPQDLPSLGKLKSEIRIFAENLSELGKAESVMEYYSGPVLFEEEGCMRVLSDNLLNQAGLFAYRKPENEQKRPTLEDRMGKKIVDGRITIKNYSTLNKYNNVSLLGAYEIDAEGVVPPKEITLVENGMLKRMLNGRVPTLKAPETTGSSRFVPTNEQVGYLTGPGTVHVQVQDGTKPEKMKKMLIKAAKEEGLEYAYVVRRIAGASTLLYKVNVKDGSEMLVRTGNFSISLSKLKRLLAISNEERVVNYVLNQSCLTSIIYPSSILVEDIEIQKLEARKEKAPALTLPLQREMK